MSTIDLSFDGADEVDASMNLMKVGCPGPIKMRLGKYSNV